MKKKSIKSLKLKKSKISNFQNQEIKGGNTNAAFCYFTYTIATALISIAVCPKEKKIDDAVVSDGGEYSCNCTVA